MNKYHKIYNIWTRDPVSHKYNEGTFFNNTLNFCKNLWWQATEKIDGMNIRVIWDAGNATVKFRGKTDAAMLPAKLLDNLQLLFPEGKFVSYPSMTLYGEGFGAGIQKAGVKYISNDQSFILFDIFDHETERWAPRGFIEDFAKEMGINVVPIVAEGTLEDLSDFVRFGFRSLVGDIEAEGVVARPIEEMYNRYGERVIVKIKTKDFYRGM